MPDSAARLPFQVAGPLVEGHDTGFGGLGRDDQQVTVDQRILDDRPLWQSLAAAKVLPDVLLPDRLSRLRADGVQVSHRPDGVDEFPVDGGRRARTGEHETAGSTVGEGPQFLAARQIEHAQGVAHLLVAVQQVHVAAEDSGPAETDGQRHRPEHLRAFLRPCPQESLLLGGMVPARTIEPRPISRDDGGERQRDQDRNELGRTLHR